MENDAKATIKIPRALYRRLQTVVDRSGFDSVTDFIVYVLRDLVSVSATSHARERIAGPNPASAPEEQPFTPEELEVVTARLKALGYL